MKAIKQAQLGIEGYSRAHRFIVKHKLWKYIILTGIFNLALIVAMIFISMPLTTALLDGVKDFFGEVEGWLETLVWWTVFIGIRILLAFLYLMIYKYLVLILMSPIMAFISEEVDKILTGRKYGFRLEQLLRDMLRGMVIAVRNMFIELIVTVIMFFVGFIPIVGVAAPFAVLAVQSYYYGFSMIDYTNERKHMSISQSVRYVRKNWMLAFANGGLFYLIFLIPFVGWMVAPTYGVVAATLSVHKLDEQNNLVDGNG